MGRGAWRSWSDELEANPLPASFEVFLRAGPGAAECGDGRGRRGSERGPGVEEVRFDRAWLRRLEALLDLARSGAPALALVVFAAVVFVMASVLRLAVYARRDEIEIMLLVGATPAFVRGPFLVAGVAQGLVASLLALAARRRACAGRRWAYAAGGRWRCSDLVAARPAALRPCRHCSCCWACWSAWPAAYFAVRRSA